MASALGALWAWGLVDKAIISYYSNKYKGVPLPEKANYSSEDVSILVPTIDTESTFTECMRLWLKARPREIIIITVARNKNRVESLIEPFRQDFDNINILVAPQANKRQQLIVGVKAAKGSIYAVVDDDVYWRTDTVVPYLLAPFENSSVGAVAGIQSAEIPPERQNVDSITPWEAIAIYDLHQWKGSREVHFAADGGCWCLSARTLFIRATILQDKNFVHAYTHELIGRTLVNTADDVFLTEWVFDHGWQVSIQNVIEAEVTTNIHVDHKFAWQVLRWDRGNFRSFLGYLWAAPGARKMIKRHPYTTYKMIERLARPIWAFAYTSAWLKTLRTTPWIAWAYIAWLLCGWGGFLSSTRSFLRKYPFCRLQVWTFVLMDYVGPVVDIYVYLTMNNDSWLTREADTQELKD